jgi:hypothetical protein
MPLLIPIYSIDCFVVCLYIPYLISFSKEICNGMEIRLRSTEPGFYYIKPIVGLLSMKKTVLLCSENGGKALVRRHRE